MSFEALKKRLLPEPEFILVYRIENCKGVGPYLGTDTGSWQDSWENHNSESHPGPNQDTILLHNKSDWFGYCGYTMDDSYFGFKTEREIYEWFSKTELSKLRDLGFEVKVYKVEKPYYLVGSRQVMFIKEKATCQQMIY